MAEKPSGFAMEKKIAMIEKLKTTHGLDDTKAEMVVNSVLVDANLDRIIRTPRGGIEPLAGGIIINNCND